MDDIEDNLPILNKLGKRLVQEAETIALQLAQGNCATYSDYKELSGTVKGLNIARILLDDIIKEYE